MRRRVLPVAVFVVVLLLVGSLSVLSVMRSSADARYASEDARRASSSASSSPSASPTPAERTITVISDEIALDSPPQDGVRSIRWPILVGRELGVDVVSLSTGGSGYIAKPTSASFGGTFEAKAAGVEPTSSVVVFFGGANDVNQPRVSLGRAVGRSIESARRAAPDATIVIVGPPATQEPASPQLRTVRDVLRAAARTADVRFIDPITQRWLTSDDGVIGDDGSSLTREGEEIVATRIESVLRPLLR